MGGACASCGGTVEIAGGPDGAHAVCPRCGQAIELHLPLVVLVPEPDPAFLEPEPAPRTPIPGTTAPWAHPAGSLPGPSPGLAWERRAEVGVLRGLLATSAEFLLAPRAAARRMRSATGLADPLLFALLLGAFGASALLFWTGGGAALFLRPAGEPGQEGLAPGRALVWGAVFLGAALSPLVVLVALCTSALLVHLGVRTVAGRGAGFAGTFRSLSYSAGTGALFAALPILGLPLGLVVALAATVASLAGVHGVSVGRAATAVLLPIAGLLVAGCSAAGIVILALVAAVGGGG